MATQLFGPTPLEIQQAQQAGLQQKATQYATLNPLERAAQTMYQAGSNLGGGIAGLMGVQDPAMARQSKLVEITSKYDINSSDELLKAAKDLKDAGFLQESLAASDRAQEMKKSESALSLEAARTKYFEGGGARGTAKVVGAVGKIRPEAYEKESVQAFYESVDAGKPDYSLLNPKDKKDKVLVGSPEGKLALDEGLVPGTTEFGNRVKEISQEKANKPSASIVKELSNVAGTIVSLQQSGAKLDKLIPTIQQMDLGVVSNFFRSGAAAMGINTEDRTKFDALKRTVIGEANKLLLMAKGTQTEGDAVRARDQVVSDATWKNAEALTTALNDLKDSHASTVKELEAKQQVLTSGGRPTPVTAPKAPTNVDWAAAFAKQQALNPAWKNFTLEQFKQKAGAK